MQHTSIDAPAVEVAEYVPIDHFQRALASREDIDQAKGILIALFRVPGDEAWQMLSTASQHGNIKLRRIAAALVEIMSGEAPRDEPAAALARLLLATSAAAPGNVGLQASDRALLGAQRDRLAAARDEAASRRDHEAEVRDQHGEHRQVAAGAASDRVAARRDRQSAAVDREISADDRAAAEVAENS